MLTDTAFATRRTETDNMLLNLLMTFRQFRRREFAFTEDGAKYYEDGLLALRVDLGALQGEYEERFGKVWSLIDRMAGVLRRNLPAEASGPDLIELGEIHDGLKELMQGRGLLPSAAPVPAQERQPADFTSTVYVPEENRPQGFLEDMATASLGTFRPLGTNVVPFKGRRRRSAIPEGRPF